MKHWTTRLAFGALLAGSLCLYACGDDGGDDGGTPDGGSAEPAYTGTYNHYVTNMVKIGSSAPEAATFGFALDTLSPELDNRIGGILATFGAMLGLDAEIDAALKEGSFIILHSVRADAIATDPSVSWQVYLGDQKTNPDFSGNGTFTIKSGASLTSKLGGATANSVFTTNPAYAKPIDLEISLSATSAPLAVTLISPRIQATFSGNTCSGKIGGALKVSDLENNIIPFLATQVDNRIGMDEGCRAALANCDSTSVLILTALDSGHPNGDRRIMAAELKTNPFISGVLNPDVDLLAPFGTNDRDHVSIALAFSCVKANFTAASEN